MRPNQPNAIDLERVEGIIRRLAVAIVNRRLYSSGHKRVEEAVADLLASLRKYFSSSEGSTTLELTVEGGQICFQGVPLLEATNYAVKLLDFLRSSGFGGITISSETDGASVLELLDRIADTRGRPLGPSATADSPPPLRNSNIQLVREEAVRRREAAIESAPSMRAAAFQIPEFRVPLAIYQSSLSILHDTMLDVKAGHEVDFNPIYDVASRIAQAVAEDEGSILSMTSVKYYDEFTFNHSVNVCLLATTLMEPFISNREDLVRICQAALLHDVGKSFIPQEILYKKSKLTPEEFAVIQEHPVRGAEALLRYRQVDPLAVAVAYGHHRKDGGGGYPRARGNLPTGPITGLVSVLDIFEALTAVRPYKQSLSPQESFGILLKMDDIASRRPFIKLLFHRMSHLPPGTLVRLSTGEKAIVFRVNQDDLSRPCVKIIADARGVPVTEQIEIDLRTMDTKKKGYAYDIAEVIDCTPRLDRVFA